MNIVDVVQRSPEWFAARCGSLGASSVHEALAKTKTGWGASRANLLARLVAERLTGQPGDTFTNAAMAHGTETEPEARAAYAWHTDVDVVEVGLIRHPRISLTHASPDGLIGDDGLVEIKCPQTMTHISTLLGESIPGKHITQMMMQMACSGRLWCDYVSYDPRLSPEMRLFVKRVARDDVMIAELEREVRVFLAEVRDTVDRLQALYNPASANADVPLLAAG